MKIETKFGLGEIERLVMLKRLKCRLPFAGKNSDGTNKKSGKCPACGAGPYQYRYPTNLRWKHCYKCGFDRFEQMQFESTRWRAKRGQEITEDEINKAFDYYNRVFQHGS